jgi:hypothetical protein
MRTSAYILVVLAIPACGPGALPQETARPVLEQDVLGVWETTVDGMTMSIEFKPDHSFRQVVWTQFSIKTQDGTWNLENGSLHLQQCLAESGNALVPASVIWWFVDANADVELLGGLSKDPDSWTTLKKKSHVRL